MPSEILDYVKKLGADLAGVCPYNDETRELIKREHLQDKRDIKSIIVVGVHIADPYLDMWSYFDEMRPLSPADEFLAHIITMACLKLEKEGFHSIPLLYSTLYLKDAASHAELGVIGRNNLLVTPEFGPRVRLRALLTESELPVSDISLENPCDDCDSPCIKACPANAFASGRYDRDTCYGYAKSNLMQISSHTYLWCRECELSCRVGKG